VAGAAIQNFRIGPSLSNRMKSDSNSNRMSKLRRSPVMTRIREEEDWHFHRANDVVLSCSVERNVIITANDTAEPPTVSPPSAPLHQNETWPTASGINETEARRICQSPILQSPVFSLCQNFTVDSLQFISESCMLDLLVQTLYYQHFYALALRKGEVSVAFVRSSVAYVANNWRTQRPSVPKFGMKVLHLRCD